VTGEKLLINGIPSHDLAAVFLPVHLAACHWALVVAIPSKISSSIESVYIIDSMSGLFKTYVFRKLQERYAWLKKCHPKHVACTQQTGGNDCGYFCLGFMATLLAENNIDHCLSMLPSTKIRKSQHTLLQPIVPQNELRSYFDGKLQAWFDAHEICCAE